MADGHFQILKSTAASCRCDSKHLCGDLLSNLKRVALNMFLSDLEERFLLDPIGQQSIGAFYLVTVLELIPSLFPQLYFAYSCIRILSFRKMKQRFISIFNYDVYFYRIDSVFSSWNLKKFQRKSNIEGLFSHFTV